MNIAGSVIRQCWALIASEGGLQSLNMYSIKDASNNCTAQYKDIYSCLVFSVISKSQY